jgi:hypothetical protein
MLDTSRALSLACALIMLGLLSACGKAGCDESRTLSVHPSPDGVWTADIFEEVCTDGAFVTVASTLIRLRRNAGREKPQEVVVTEAYDGPTAVTWRDNQTLEVVVPAHQAPFCYTNSFHGVAVLLHRYPHWPSLPACQTRA